MDNILFTTIRLNELESLIQNSVEKALNANSKPQQISTVTEQYLSRQEVAKLLKINLSTVWSWSKKGALKSYAIEGRIFYKRHEVEASLIPLKPQS